MTKFDMLSTVDTVLSSGLAAATSEVLITRWLTRFVATTFLNSTLNLIGIGRGIVVELWRRGARVVAASDRAESLASLRRECPGVETTLVDLRDWAATRRAVEQLGVFDGLVNNAGIIFTEPFLEVAPERFDATMSVNVRAMLNVSQVISKKMIENNIKGSIVNISSQTSKAALKNHATYCASKGAVDALTRVMALELGPRGVRANAVNPTAVMTDLGRAAWPEPAKSLMLAKIPLGRFAEVCDVASAVLFLLSERASMINEVELPVDGGFLAT